MSRVRITQKTNYLIMQNLRHIIFMWRQLLPPYYRAWKFFEYIKEALNQVRVTLCRTDALHHYNRLLVCLNSKFDKLK